MKTRRERKFLIKQKISTKLAHKEIIWLKLAIVRMKTKQFTYTAKVSIANSNQEIVKSAADEIMIK